MSSVAHRLDILRQTRVVEGDQSEHSSGGGNNVYFKFWTRMAGRTDEPKKVVSECHSKLSPDTYYPGTVLPKVILILSACLNKVSPG